MQKNWKRRVATASLLSLLGGCSSRAGETEQEEPMEEEAIADVVALDSAARRAAQLELVEVEQYETSELFATGVIEFDQNRVSYIGPRAEGRVVRVATDLGAHVRPGQALAVLESPELGEARGEYERASAELTVAMENSERETNLYEQQISSRKEMLEAQAAYQSAIATLRAAEARLRTLGAAPGGEGAEFIVSSPISGDVVERDIVPGQMAGPEDLFFVVADLARLWLIVDVYDKDLGKVEVGQLVEVKTQAFPTTVFPGEIVHVGRVVDPSTRTLKVRVVVDNVAHDLRPGMFAQAIIQVTESAQRLVVSEAAVQDLDGRAVVFVPEPDGEQFRVVDVMVGQKVGVGLIAILSGLEPGQTIVGRGAFYLKSELLKGTFGEDEG